MKIERIIEPVVTLNSFAEMHDLTLVIGERDDPSKGEFKYFVYFKDCSLSGQPAENNKGEAQTEAEAISAYARKISKQTLLRHNKGVRQFADLIDVPKLKIKE